jgi:hypothetical protein
MSTTSSFSTITTREEVHTFTNLGPFNPYEKPRKLEWEFNRVFQNIWATKLSWLETIVGLIGSCQW